MSAQKTNTTKQYEVVLFFQNGTEHPFRGTYAECKKWIERHSKPPYNYPPLWVGMYAIIPAND